MSRNKECTDHLGNVFKSKKERAKFYNIRPETVSQRLERGCTLEEALTTPISDNTKPKECTDYLGNVFKSEFERAKFYNMNVGTVNKRLERGCTLEEALTESPDWTHASIECTDHLGNVFGSLKERAEFYGKDVATIEQRLSNGKSLEEALTKPTSKASKSRQCTDHLGNVFNSEKERAEFYNIHPKTVSQRLENGKSLEEALTTPSSKKYNKCTDHLGNVFNSEKERAKFYNTSTSTVNGRLSNGYILEEALTKKRAMFIDPVNGQKYYAKYLCDKYNISKYTLYGRLKSANPVLVRILEISFYIKVCDININKTKYNLTVHKRIKKGKDIFECYIDNEDGTSTFKIMSYEMIDQYCLEQYKKLHNYTLNII